MSELERKISKLEKLARMDGAPLPVIHVRVSLPTEDYGDDPEANAPCFGFANKAADAIKEAIKRGDRIAVVVCNACDESCERG